MRSPKLFMRRTGMAASVMAVYSLVVSCCWDDGSLGGGVSERRFELPALSGLAGEAGRGLFRDCARLSLSGRVLGGAPSEDDAAKSAEEVHSLSAGASSTSTSTCTTPSGLLSAAANASLQLPDGGGLAGPGALSIPPPCSSCSLKSGATSRSSLLLACSCRAPMFSSD